jgi:hypothetical protein
LTPLDDLGGLTPVGDMGGLTPVGGPGGAAPSSPTTSDDLFADLSPASGPGPLGAAGGGTLPSVGAGLGGPAASPFGGASTGVNPYASPAASSAGSYGGYGGGGTKTRRSGLPWDKPEQADSPFFGTVKMVLFSPTDAFRRMHRKGGLGRPLAFCVGGVLMGTIATNLYSSLFQFVAILAAASRAEPGEGGAMIGTVLVGIAVGFVAGLGMAALMAVLWAFLNAAMMHLSLAVLGSADQPYETTFRVVCYAVGATSLYQVVPCGGLIGGIACLIILGIGLANAHETDGGRAAAAVILPVVICCMLCSTLIGAFDLALTPDFGE